MAKEKFDCMNCLGICCSAYERVEVTVKDIRRLAKHFGITMEAATSRYTKMVDGERVLRRKRDPLLGRTCILHDLKGRVCGHYEARPEVCRVWPTRLPHGDGRCVYYDLLEFERDRQNSADVIPLVQITFVKNISARG